MRGDVVVVGSGPAGAASALHLLAAGLRPVLLEKSSFPRYHIGESLTGECGQALRAFGLEPRMRTAGWPVKHGVTVYGAGGVNTFRVPVARRNEQGQLEPATTWQVRRSDFDRMLQDEALARGAELVEGEAVAPLVEGGIVRGVSFRSRSGRLDELRGEVLLDASGQATFLASRSGLTSGREIGPHGRQIAIFSQVRGARRGPGEVAGDTLIFTQRKDHWAWMIPLDDEVTSVGIVVPAEYFKAQGQEQERFLAAELATLNPELGQRVAGLAFVEPVRAITSYSYHVRKFTGPGFLCVGDAHRFIDPIFSFGVHFAVREASLAVAAIRELLGAEASPTGDPFAAYSTVVERGQDVIQDLLALFWAQPVAFMIFAHHQYREGLQDLFAGRVHDPDVDQVACVRAVRERLRGAAAAPPA